MNAHGELKKAIVDKLTSSSSFATAISNKVYYMIAPQGTVTPYCVYSFFADTHTYDSGNDWEQIFIQFSLYHKDNSSATITILESYLIDLLKDATLTFTNFTQLQLTRLNKRYLLGEDGIWTSIIEYRIEIEHN